MYIEQDKWTNKNVTLPQTYTNLSLRWIIDLSVAAKVIKLLFKENLIREHLNEFRIYDNFLRYVKH